MCCGETVSVRSSSFGHAKYFSEEEARRIATLLSSRQRSAERDAELAGLLQTGGTVIAQQQPQRPQRTVCESCCTLKAAAACQVQELIDGKWQIVGWTTKSCSLYERLIVCSLDLFGSLFGRA